MIKEWLLIPVILLFGDLFLDTLQFVLELFITCDPVTSKVFFSFFSDWSILPVSSTVLSSELYILW